jgi:hypothetical protein
MNPPDHDPTSNDEEDVDAMGRKPARLQLSKIFMHVNAENRIVKWDGKNPAGRCSVFILSNLEDSFMHSNIDIGDLRYKQFEHTHNPSFNVARIPTASLIKRNVGCPLIGTYLQPPSNGAQGDGITIQEAQTLLPNLMAKGHILHRRAKNTFWFKFNELEYPDFDFENHLPFLPTCIKSDGKFIHNTLTSNILDNGRFYTPLKKYIPLDPSVSLLRSLQQRYRIGKTQYKPTPRPTPTPRPSLRPTPGPHKGGKSRRKLKISRRRTRRGTRRRSRRGTRRGTRRQRI